MASAAEVKLDDVKLSECKSALELIKSMHRLQTQFEAHMQHFPGILPPLEQRQQLSLEECMKCWELHHHDWLGHEPINGGRNGADLLFILCCYRLASQDTQFRMRELSEQLNAKQVLSFFLFFLLDYNNN
jgi:hypothetical protein